MLGSSISCHIYSFRWIVICAGRGRQSPNNSPNVAQVINTTFQYIFMYISVCGLFLRSWFSRLPWQPLLLCSLCGTVAVIAGCVLSEVGNKSRVKAVPLQAWSGPEGSRKLRFPDFMTTAQKGGKVVSLTHRPHLPPGNPPGTHFC